ncbi:unnamed protein product [Allacma fusca]|uniref:BTB domain-containing protein n=1 Tax=Allacma fusca TaxID=39272 RepID=A0A8J2K3V8_9HEXA|nr:unnamed protein product [Allacma fusca]
MEDAMTYRFGSRGHNLTFLVTMFRSSQFFDYMSNWKDLKNFDTRILCSDGECWTHRLVLCHVSPYMGSLLDDQFPGEETVYSIPDISRVTMNLLLELAYTGSVSSSQSKFEELQDAMKFLGWIRVDQCEIIISQDDETKSPESVSDTDKPESEATCVSGIETKKFKETPEVSPESTKSVSLVTDEAAAKAVMEDILLQIEHKQDVCKVDETVSEQDHQAGTDGNHSQNVHGLVDVESKQLSVNNKAELSGRNGLGITSVEYIELDDDASTEGYDVSVAPSECEIIEECKGAPQDGRNSDRKRKREVLVTSTKKQNTPSFVSSKRASLRIRAAAGKKLNGDIEPDSTPHSVKNDVNEGSNSSQVVASETCKIEPGNGAGLRNKKVSTPSTPNKSEPLRGQILDVSVSSKTRPALYQDTLHANGSSIVDITESSPRRKRSTRVSNISSPDKGLIVQNSSDSESNSTIMKSRARGGKISISDWKKLVVCSVCDSKSNPSQTEACLLSHNYLRCWTCLDAIPSLEFESHRINIHKEKTFQEFILCKWCGAEGNSAWIGDHVVSHSPPRKFC